MSIATALALEPNLTGAAEVTPAAARETIAAYLENPTSPLHFRDVVACRRRVAEQIAALPAAQKDGPGVDLAREFMRQFTASGIFDYVADETDLAAATSYRKQGWPGLLAAMVLVPAWQWRDLPSFNDVPMWLWNDFGQYVFTPPQTFTVPGQADAYAAFTLRRLEELARLSSTNRGSSAVRGLLATYRSVAKLGCLTASAANLRRHLELHQRIIAAAEGFKAPEPMEPRFCIGRKLKVGIIAESFGDAEAGQILPYFDFLDAGRFEVVLFAANSVENNLERYAASRAARWENLPFGIEERLELLRAAELDAAVLATSATRPHGGIGDLGHHRFAPLQIVAGTDCTTGHREIDVLVAGTDSHRPGDEEQFSERLGLISGTGFGVSPDAPALKVGAAWTRAELNLPDQAIVFSTCVEGSQLTPETQEAWARVLARSAGSYLVVESPNYLEAVGAWKRLAADFGSRLALHGVDRQRVIFLSFDAGFADENRPLHGLADAFLAPLATVRPGVLLDAIVRGTLIVAADGDSMRTRFAANLLRDLDLPELVVGSADAYVEAAVGLAENAAVREALKARLQEKLARLPMIADSLAVSEAFGTLVEKAHDDMLNVGSEAFRRNRVPLTVDPIPDVSAAINGAVDLFRNGREGEAMTAVTRILAVYPTSPFARQLMGAALLRANQPERATAYLLAAIQHDENNPGLWHDMAIALRRTGQNQPAIQALQTCVQMDPTQLERQEMLRTWIEELNAAAGGETGSV